jgi:hypothetical protein
MRVSRERFRFRNTLRYDIFDIDAQRLFDRAVVLGNRLYGLCCSGHTMFGDAELGELTWIHSFSNVFSVLFLLKQKTPGVATGSVRKGSMESGKRFDFEAKAQRSRDTRRNVLLSRLRELVFRCWKFSLH